MKSIVIVGVLVTTVAVGATGSGQAPSTQATARPAPSPLNNQPMEIPLWEGGAPGALGDADIDKPTLTIYRAARVPTGTGVVVAPGGGYSRAGHGSRRTSGRLVVQRDGDLCVRVEGPTRASLPPSHRARRRATRDPDRPVREQKNSASVPTGSA